MIVYDINFISTAPTVGSANDEIPFHLNMEAVLAAPFATPVPTPISNLAVVTLGGLLAAAGWRTLQRIETA